MDTHVSAACVSQGSSGTRGKTLLGTAGGPELLGVLCTRRPHGRALLSRCPLHTPTPSPVSYTHLRAHETSAHL
eukprot:883581-Alexandrium_andersonii.AAC.1